MSTIARIESGTTDPRVKTMTALLGLCGDELVAIPALGVGVDRTLIRSALAQWPKQRLLTLASAASALNRIRGKARPRNVAT